MVCILPFSIEEDLMSIIAKKTFPVTQDTIPAIADYIESSLTLCKTRHKEILSAKLIAEETVTSIVNGGYAQSDITVQIRKTIWKTDVLIRFKGPQFQISADNTGLDFANDDDEITQSIINSIILKSYSGKLAASYRNGVNTVTIAAGVSSQKSVLFCLFSMILAVLTSILLRLFAPQQIISDLYSCFLNPVTTIIMNALKMLMVPIVFFSIASSMGTFKDIREFGRIGVKIFVFYTVTTVIAALIGYGTFQTFNRLEAGSLSHFNNGLVTDAASVSFLSTIVNIFPSNIFASFHNADTLQIIFLAILLGICVNKTGKYASDLIFSLNALNDLFMKAAAFVAKFIPLVVYTSLCSLLITTDIHSILNLSSILLLIVIASIFQNIIYLILCLVKTGTPPLQFIKKAGPGWLNGISLCSSNAAIPFTMNVCKERLKISPKIYSFSIPLGATINMDATTIMLTISGLSLAKGFGLTLSTGDIVSFLFIIIMLSMGTPGIPGCGIMALTILCQQFNIPAAGIALITPVIMLADPIDTGDNLMGDMCCSYCVAKSEGLIDE